MKKRGKYSLAASIGVYDGKPTSSYPSEMVHYAYKMEGIVLLK
jgi:hypothetical protein